MGTCVCKGHVRHVCVQGVCPVAVGKRAYFLTHVHLGQGIHHRAQAQGYKRFSCFPCYCVVPLLEETAPGIQCLHQRPQLVTLGQAQAPAE